MKDFLERLTEMIGTDQKLKMEMYLDDIEEWDSLSVVSFAAMVDVEYNIQIQAVDVRKAKTVADLYAMIQK